MPQNALYYAHSGKTGTGSALNLARTAILTGLIAGAIYGLVSRYNPFIYVTVLGNLLVGALAGMSICVSAMKNHVRNAWLPALIGTVAGVIGIYVSWVIWLHFMSPERIWIFNPLKIFLMQLLMAQEGMWSLRGITPTGIWLMLIWAVEALLFIGIAGLMAYARMNDVAYCETCRRWLSEQNDPAQAKHETGPLVEVQPFDDVKRALEQGDMRPLTQLSAAEEPLARPATYLKASVERCLGCGGLNLLTITRQAKGKKQSDDSDKQILQKLKLSNESLALLHVRFWLPPGAQEDQPNPPSVEIPEPEVTG